MTTFARLKSMSDKQIQDWLKKVGITHVVSLGIALLGADNETKQCVFRNMSAKAGAILSQDIEKNKQLGFAQKDILHNAEKLEKLL